MYIMYAVDTYGLLPFLKIDVSYFLLEVRMRL